MFVVAVAMLLVLTCHYCVPAMLQHVVVLHATLQDISAVQAALHAAAQQSATVPTAFVPIPSTDSTSTPGGAASAASPASETSATSPVLSEELQGLLATIEQLREAFEDRERPSGLPQPGQPLPEPQLVSLCTRFIIADEHLLDMSCCNKHRMLCVYC